jgi:hypothetical protein
MTEQNRQSDLPPGNGRASGNQDAGDAANGEAVPADLIAKLLGTTVVELRDHPEVAKEKFAKVFRELAQLRTQEGGPYALDSTRELMSRIRQELQASGEKVPDQLDALPETIAALSDRLQDTTPGELTDFLRGLSGLIESPDKDNADLDRVVSWFETNLAPLLLSLDQQRQRQEANTQAEYREAAKRSIAASLRKHGIQPLTTDPEPPRQGGKMNRQRLFWKEFAESSGEIKRLLAGGEDELATKRVEELLDAYDLDLSIGLSLEGEAAVLAFLPSDNLETAILLQLVVRDSPNLQGWRFVRGSRHDARRREVETS